MLVRIRNKKDYTTKVWQGGETTELLIWPPSADYAKRDFQWRISKAGITAMQSQFTLLTGVRRWLLLLNGALLLDIDNKGTLLVLPGDEIKWNGKDAVQCKGTGTDFNIMIRGKGKAHAELISLQKNESKRLNTMESGQKYFLYLLSGKLLVKAGKNEYLLQKEMSMEIDILDVIPDIFIEAKTNCEWVLCELAIPAL